MITTKIGKCAENLAVRLSTTLKDFMFNFSFQITCLLSITKSEKLNIKSRCTEPFLLTHFIGTFYVILSHIVCLYIEFMVCKFTYYFDLCNEPCCFLLIFQLVVFVFVTDRTH
jgi:hypothetical protein